MEQLLLFFVKSKAVIMSVITYNTAIQNTKDQIAPLGLQKRDSETFASLLSEIKEIIQAAPTAPEEKNYLDLSISNPFYRPEKPSIKEFMDKTGASIDEAIDLIYGVIGSNADYRDWTKIMSSESPIEAARTATGQNYTLAPNIKSSGSDSGSLKPTDRRVNDHLYIGENGEYIITAKDCTILSVLSSAATDAGAIKEAKRFGLDISEALKATEETDIVDTEAASSDVMSTMQTTVPQATPQKQPSQTGQIAAAESKLGGYKTQSVEKTVNDAITAFNILKELLQKI